jgi:predicted transcriptional regulator
MAAVTTAPHTTAAPPDQLLGEPTAGDMMRTSVVTVDAAEHAVMTFALVRRSGHGVALVFRNGAPAGLVDEYSLHRAALRALLYDAAGDAEATVASCLPRRCVRIPVTAALGTVAEHLLRSPIGAALVTDGGTVVGVITVPDLLRALSHPLPRRRATRTRRAMPAPPAG